MTKHMALVLHKVALCIGSAEVHIVPGSIGLTTDNSAPTVVYMLAYYTWRHVVASNCICGFL